jgi:PAS domain S-box-containing protein
MPMTTDPYLVNGIATFNDLVDMERLRAMFHDYATPMDFSPGLITHPKQEVLIEPGTAAICATAQRDKVGPAYPAYPCQSSARARFNRSAEPRQSIIATCEHGLADATIPVVVRGRHIATLVTGQVLFEPPDMEQFRQQATEHSYDVDAYLAAIARLPVVSREHFTQMLSMLAQMVVLLAEQGLADRRHWSTTQAVFGRQAIADSIIHDAFGISTVGTFILDDQFRVVWVNNAIKQFFGLQQPDITGRDKRELIRGHIADIFEEPEEFREKVLATYSDNSYIEEFECHVLPGENREDRWLKHWSQPIRSGQFAGGRVEHYTDITAQKQAESAAQQSAARSRLTFELAPTGIGVVINRHFKEVNDCFCTMTGYPREELLDQDARILYATEAEYQEVGQEKYRQIRATGSGTVETRFKRKDGKIIHVLLSTTPFDPRNPAAGFMSTALDITDRILAETALREREENMRITLNSIGEAVIAVDLHSKITAMNPVAEQLVATSESEARGMPLATVLNLVDATTREPLPDLTAQALTGDPVVNHTGNRLLLTGDRERYVSHSAAPIQAENGNISGVVLVLRDITAELRHEQAQRRMQQLESLGTIAGGIAHDFNNLLSGVFGNIELAQYNLPHGLPAGKYLHKAYSALNNARQLTGRLLTFAGGGEPELQRVNTRAMVQDTIAFTLSGSPVRPRFELPPELWAIEADRGQLEQVLSELTLNARQAMPDGGTLTVSGENVPPAMGDDNLRSDIPYIRLTLRDEGVGIPAGNIDRIFEPYFSTKETGRGLGLAIAHSVVTRHGGRIQVDSTPDAGTTMTLLLPAVPEEQVLPEEKADPERQVLQSLRVLLMDDEAMLRILGQEMLQLSGHTVETATDGVEALKKYTAARERGRPFDLVILDLTIAGGMGGKATIKELLSLVPAARVIVASGYSNDPVLTNYGDYGFAGRLIKPFRLKDLQQEIARVMSDEA